MKKKEKLKIIEEIEDLLQEIWSKSIDLTSNEEAMINCLQGDISTLRNTFNSREG